MNHNAPNHYGHGVTNAEIVALREERAALLKALDDLVGAWDRSPPYLAGFLEKVQRARLVLTTLKQEEKQ